MNQAQRNAVDQCWTELQQSLDVHSVSNYLRVCLVFSSTDFELVNIEQTEDRRRMKLLEIVKRKDDGWQALLNGLSTHGQRFLTKQLEDALNQFQATPNPQEKPRDPKDCSDLSNFAQDDSNASTAAINIPPIIPTMIMLSTPANVIRQDKNQKFIRTNVWKKVAMLGMGSQADVYAMKNEHASGTECAMKVVRLINLKSLTRTHEPYEILMLLEHPNIVRYFDYSIDPKKLRAKIYMEKLQGSLSDYIKNLGPLRETQALKICQNIFSGLAYMHDLGLIHRDLKKGIAKISDFISSKLTSNAFISKPGTGMRGAIYFRAPETIKGTYSGKADVWSVGCILVHMLSGNVPNHELSEYQVAAKYAEQGRPDYTLPAETSLKVFELIECLLAADTAIRPASPTALQYIDHTIAIVEIEQPDQKIQELA